MTFHRKLSERVSLGTYTAATYLITPFLALHLKKRLKYDKEHPKRWREKQGFTNVPRPNGKVIWLNAVGLGEVMALRGLIHKFHDLDPDLNFLVTSSTRTSSETFTKDLPPKTIHQFLPLDTQIYSKRFLNHWRPNLALWSEQDIWPGLVHRVARRGIPQALINARMNSRSLQNKTIVRPLFSTTYKTFSFISAQEKETAAAIVALGALQDIHIDGSLKPHCPPLFVNPDTQTAFKSKDRKSVV
jgi:3-deoxy-D-manno-octulosonic-acid transferase